MEETVTTCWLRDKNGDKVAPKTLVSQVQTSDGTLLENHIASTYATKWNTVNNASVSVSITLADKTEYYLPNATTVNINAPDGITKYECWVSIGSTNPTISFPATMECVGADNRNIYTNIGYTEISIKNGRYTIGCAGT